MIPSISINHLLTLLLTIFTLTPTPATASWECGEYRDNKEESSAISPKWRDCLQLRANINNGGTWKFISGTQTTLASYLTCAIGVDSAEGNWAGTWVKVGHQDIINIVEMMEKMILEKNDPNQVVQDKKTGKAVSVKPDARVGGRGSMKCYQYVLRWEMMKVYWGVYHYCPKGPKMYC
ncbi:putative necrosis-inducing factor-domain-containing protein [Sordaria brevicollis]|uniref:Necrosis-inducing factor-domain-containing protein n=1 Tax=Sordaria brevicollis TaxID=83679 RepID=A0AAE0PGK1_SORBR|nr:putative necrosis-inducing factor-domain-containing protein [Sordaria brevicollis]